MQYQYGGFLFNWKYNSEQGPIVPNEKAVTKDGLNFKAGMTLYFEDTHGHHGQIGDVYELKTEPSYKVYKNLFDDYCLIDRLGNGCFIPISQFYSGKKQIVESKIDDLTKQIEKLKTCHTNCY